MSYLGLTTLMWSALRAAPRSFALAPFADHSLQTMEALERRGYLHVKLDDTGRYLWRATASGQRLRNQDTSFASMFKGVPGITVRQY